MFCLHNVPIQGLECLIDREMCLLVCWQICLVGFDRLFGSFYSHINFLSFFNLLHFLVLLTGVFWPRKLRSQGHIILLNAVMGVLACRGMSYDGFQSLVCRFFFVSLIFFVYCTYCYFRVFCRFTLAAKMCGQGHVPLSKWIIGIAICLLVYLVGFARAFVGFFCGIQFFCDVVLVGHFCGRDPSALQTPKICLPKVKSPPSNP